MIEPTWAEVDAFVRAHPDGAELDEIAALLQCTKEHVRAIERRALRKLSVALGNRGFLAGRGVVSARVRHAHQLDRVRDLVAFEPMPAAEVATLLGCSIQHARNLLKEAA